MSDKETILIVDDEPALLKVLSKRLAGAHYKVETRDDSLEGFLAAKDIMPSLIILDMMMPRMDGMEFKKKLGEDSLVSDIPVIFLTANSSINDKIKALRLGADDFVTKPFDFEELLARVQSSIDRRKRFEEIAVTDPMTGLANVRIFKKESRLLFDVACRYNRIYSLMLIDLDDLKIINDRYGHAAGDQALKTVASVMAGIFRMSDKLIRYGGDEFAVLMPETDQKQAELAAVRLKDEIEKTSLKLQNGLETSISVSAGCATYAADMVSEEELFKMADQALYKDKKVKKQLKRTEKSILIIEDEEAISRSLAFRLKRETFEVDAAEDGEEGLRKARLMHPDLIILDLRLPVIPGEEVCKAIREDADREFAKTPIIMVTAKSSDSDRVIGNVIGATYYMTKPYDFPDLLKNIHSAINREA